MDEPLLSDATAKNLHLILHRPPHSLLLTGDSGIGKATIARWVAAKVLSIKLDALDNYSYLTIIEPEKGSISVDAVRSLMHILSLRTARQTAGIARVVIIQDAQLLTLEAQNALLKNLEEPPVGTMLILTATRRDALLPTVCSRLHDIEVGRPDTAAVRQLLIDQKTPSDDVNGIMAISGGLPGLAIAMAAGDNSHPLVTAAQFARQLLQQSSFERLSAIEKLSKDREQSRQVAYILMQMAHAALLTGRGAERWQKVMQASYRAETLLSQNASVKLTLTSLMLNL